MYVSRAKVVPVHIEILGPLSIRTGETRRAIQAKKVRALLALLALNARHVVSFDEMVDELWTECTMQNARNALHANALRLRKQLELCECGLSGRELLRTAANGYVLDIEPASLDANQFQRMAERGSELHRSSPHEAIGLLRTALSLWRGPALVDAGDGLRCRAAAVRLEERRISAQEDLVAAEIEAGGARSAVAELRQLVAQYPERERLSEQLMLALYRCGRQTEALDVFHRTRQWLGSQLGLEPLRPLHVMYQAILIQDPDLALHGDS